MEADCRFEYDGSLSMNRNGKIAVAGAAGALIVVVALFVSAPYSAVRSLQEAARKGDSQAIEQYVDFPAFRASIKDTMRRQLAKKMGVVKPGVFGGVGKMLADMALEPIAAKIASPVGIALLVEGVAPTEIADGETKTPRRIEKRGKFDGIDRFRMHVISGESGESLVALVMSRQGFLNWKLVGIE